MSHFIRRRGHAAFTLVELMSVVLIMILLAGLVIGGLGFVNERKARDQAKVQLALLANALQEYQADNGSYPPTPDTTNGLGNSDVLYEYLYLDSDQDDDLAPETSGQENSDEDQRIYVPELGPDNQQGWLQGTGATAKILDPWGNEYRYRVGGASNPSTENPDYDLWSAGKDGKSDPSDPKHPDNKDDLKNF